MRAFIFLLIGTLLLCAWSRDGRAETTVSVLQCQGDVTLEIVSEHVAKANGIRVAASTIDYNDFLPKLVAGLRSGAHPFDMVWGCPHEFLDPLLKTDLANAFVAIDQAAKFSTDFVGPDKKWIPIDVDIGTICASTKEADVAAKVKAAFEGNPKALLDSTLVGSIGIRDPVLSDYGFYWLDALARPMGYNEIASFAGQWKKAKPIIGNDNCLSVAGGKVRAALSSWSEALYTLNTAPESIRPIVPRDTWATPTAAAILSGSSNIKEAMALIDALSDEGVKAQMRAQGLIIPPAPGSSAVSLPEAFAQKETISVHAAPDKGAASDNRKALAKAADQVSDACSSNVCSTCPEQCELCEQCTNK